jgi:hypothetical protein
MFKYISEILSKFSQQQRILALVILLVAIFLMTFGNRIIDEVSQTDESLKKEIGILKRNNVRLLNQNDTLQSMIVDNQIQCSEDIAEVRRTVLEDLGILEKNLMLTRNNTSEPQYYTTTHLEYEPHIEKDVEVVERMMVSETPEPVMMMTKPKRSLVLGGRPNSPVVNMMRTKTDTIKIVDTVVHERLVVDTVLKVDSIALPPQNNNTSTTMMLEGIRKLKEKIKN